MAFTIDNKKMARNTFALYVRTGITMIISFFTARVTLQVLGVDDYGLYNLVGSVVALFSFLNSSMGTAVQRFLNIEIGKGNEERLAKIYGVSVYLHIIVAIITIAVAEIFALFFLNKMNIPQERMYAAHVVFQISSISMALMIINVPNYALLKARELFSKLAIIDIIQAFLRLLVLYLLYTVDFDKLIIYSLLNLGVTIYYVLSIYLYAKKFPESHHRPCRDRSLVKEMFKFISLLILTVLAEVLRNQGLVMLINLFFSLAVNAAYAIAHQVYIVVNSFIINIKQPMIPQMVSAYGAGDKKSMATIIFMGTKITCLMLLIISLPIMFESKIIFDLWLKTPPVGSSRLLVLVLINANIASFTYFLYQGVHATGDITKQQLFISGLYFSNVLFIYLAFKLGAAFEVALYITIMVSLVQCILNVVFAKKYYNLNVVLFLKKCVLPCISVAILTSSFLWVITWIMDSSVWRLVVVLLSGVGLCSLFGYYLVLDGTEKRYAISMVRKILRIQ